MSLFDITDFLAISKFEKSGDPRDLAIILHHANLKAGLQKSPERLAQEADDKAFFEDSDRRLALLFSPVGNDSDSEFDALLTEEPPTESMNSVEGIERMFKSIK